MYNQVIRHLCNLRHGRPDKPNTDPIPYLVITTLSTIFPRLYFHPNKYSVSTNLYFLITLPFPPSLTPSHLASLKMFSVSICLFLLCSLFMVLTISHKLIAYEYVFNSPDHQNNSLLLVDSFIWILLNGIQPSPTQNKFTVFFILFKVNARKEHGFGETSGQVGGVRKSGPCIIPQPHQNYY